MHQFDTDHVVRRFHRPYIEGRGQDRSICVRFSCGSMDEMPFPFTE